MQNNCLKITLVLVTVLIFNGCTLLSERQCREADWYNYGLSAGQRGDNEDSYFRYIEACGKYHIAVDTQAYSRGYQAGLKTYCTRDNADRIGRIGKKFKYDLCPEEQKEKLAVVYYEQATDVLEQKVSEAKFQQTMLEHDANRLRQEIQRLKHKLEKSNGQRRVMRARLKAIHTLVKNDTKIDPRIKRQIETILKDTQRL